MFFLRAVVPPGCRLPSPLHSIVACCRSSPVENAQLSDLTRVRLFDRECISAFCCLYPLEDDGPPPEGKLELMVRHELQVRFHEAVAFCIHDRNHIGESVVCIAPTLVSRLNGNLIGVVLALIELASAGE